MTKSDERRELHWLEDLNEAIDKIQKHEQFAKGKEAFDKDEHYRVWVLYHMERIGECASRLRQDFDYDGKHPDIDWRGAQIMRRHLVHRYWGIEDDKVWQGVEYLPKIKERIEGIIEQRLQERSKGDDQTRRND